MDLIESKYKINKRVRVLDNLRALGRILFYYLCCNLISYFHKDPRSDKFGGTSLTGVQAYMGNGIPALTGSVVFSDLARRDESQTPAKGVLAYSRVRPDGKPNDFSVIETNDHFGSQSAYYVSMGTNLDQTRLYLGVHGSMRVTDFNQGTVFEIVP